MMIRLPRRRVRVRQVQVAGVLHCPEKHVGRLSEAT